MHSLADGSCRPTANWSTLLCFQTINSHRYCKSMYLPFIYLFYVSVSLHSREEDWQSQSMFRFVKDLDQTSLLWAGFWVLGFHSTIHGSFFICCLSPFLYVMVSLSLRFSSYLNPNLIQDWIQMNEKVGFLWEEFNLLGLIMHRWKEGTILRIVNISSISMPLMMFVKRLAESMDDHNMWIRYISDLLYRLKSAWEDHDQTTIIPIIFDGHSDQLFAFSLLGNEL